MSKYWIDEIVRLVQQENYSIRKACFRVRIRKERYENAIRSKSKNKNT